MSEFGPEDSVPWEAPHIHASPISESLNPLQSLQGRGYFSDLGAVRRKPSRADAEPTLSKSCTDKLSLKQIISLLSFPTYHFISITPQAYLSSLILPAEKYSHIASTRAFSPTGRLSGVKHLELPPGHIFRPLKVISLPEDFKPQFPCSKPSIAYSSKESPPTLVSTCSIAKLKPKSKPKTKTKSSNLSAVYINTNANTRTILNRPTDSHLISKPSRPAAITETLLNGLHQGHTLLSTHPKKASSISRFHMLQLGQQIAHKLLSPLPQTPEWKTEPPSESLGTTHESPSLPVSAAVPSKVELEAELEAESEHSLITQLRNLVEAKTYRDAKTGSEQGIERQRVKDMVTGILTTGGGGSSGVGWPRNTGDEDWGVSPNLISDLEMERNEV